MKLDFGSLRALYSSGQARPADVIETVYERIAAGPLQPVWISLVPREAASARR